MKSFFSFTSLAPIFSNWTMDSLYPAFKQVYKSGYEAVCCTGGKQELAMPEQNIKVKIKFIDTYCIV
jgi:hypothetical protein